MATLLLAAAGSALGGALGGVGAAIGQALGGVAGAVIDRTLIRSTMSVTGPRLSDLDVQSSTEGEPIPRVYGRVRIAGQVIWATRHEETVVRSSSGGKGGVSTRSYRYYANFAVGLCEGPIARISRVWADGTALDLTAITWRVYPGTETQAPDPLILARQGGEVPAYRGLAYVVFERLPLEPWGNRIPQLTFEVIRVVDTLEARVRAVTMIPGGTEFGYATTPVTRTTGIGAAASENRHTVAAATDFLASLDELCELCPNLRRIALVVTWFGDDLRAGHCRLRPGVDAADKTTAPLVWSVAGLTRAEAREVTQIDGRAAFGGTPADASVIEAIREIRGRGLEVLLYPFVSMDVPAGNGLSDPWGGAEQAAFPWRGRITCDPAPGRVGTVDRSATATAQIAAFVGTARPADFAVADGAVVYTGPAEWSLRRMILHHAHLALAAGGVDAFLLGSEWVALNAVRDAAGGHPHVAALVALAADVRAVLGPSTRLTYGADWSEWNGHRPADGSGDLTFHLDPLWASPAVDVVGIDFYAPLADWRPGPHLDRAIADLPTDLAYLRAGVTGGEDWDWYYASDAARRAQVRTPIADGATAKPWVWRAKDLRSWWENRHFDRVGGVERPTPTAWVPGAKPIWLTELGCPAVDLGADQPNVFPDPRSSEGGVPWFSIGSRDDLQQRRTLEAVIDAWDPARDPAANPLSPVYGGPMVDLDGIHLWTWDARPFPAFPTALDVWSDGASWATGHWLNGRLGGCSLEAAIGAILADHGFADVAFRAVAGHLDGVYIDRRMSAREALEPLLAAFGIDAVDSGTAIRFAGRARRPVMTLTVDDLVDTGATHLVELRRGQESELPHEVAVTFSDALLDHRRTTVTSRRLAGAAHRTSDADLAVVAPIEAMVGVADAWLADLWASRTVGRFALDPTRIALEPGDVVDLVVADRTERLLIESLTDGAHRAVEARSLDPELYGPVRAVTRRRGGELPIARADPVVHVLDIPHADADANAHRPYLAAFAAPWPGSLAVWRRLADGGYDLVAALDRPATLGETVTDLAPGPTALWDRATILDVRLAGGTLASSGRAAVLDGAGRAAVRSPNGAWEILQYAAAELIGPATWRLGDLLRRQGGSDDAWDGIASIPAGAAFVVLDAALALLPTRPDDVGREITLRIGAADRDYTASGTIELRVTPQARGLKPWSPAHLGVTGAATGGDLVFAWVRRSRAAAADSWVLEEVPEVDPPEAYRLEIARAGTVLRRVDVATPTWTWTRADRDAALGADLADVVVSVAQCAASLGPGIPARRALRL
ncbi:hypothetical protein EYW49_02145 [Siculibacillus lacustris]|uniref:Host specificity protein n=1 Tax=Siculibacillus lacustris TaxID=1549641 RepID=A0A4Q9VX73_9HYPH|nr:glycoside hydrolase/phage tail family protein [Siculibacillus lacustris]TBW40980.1 hypothetical protein EYW49_02145 [Siculibacillus lacustris]